MTPSLSIRLVLVVGLAGLAACDGDVRIESPDERGRTRSDTVATSGVVDTVYRPAPIDSVPASFAWLIDRPPARVPTERPYPGGPEEAARQYLRALAQTGADSRGALGTGAVGYDRAFTYVHPSIRRGRTAEGWSSGLTGIVRPVVVRLAPVPGDSTRVFAELSILREVDGESLLGLYYGHLAAAPGDNGWQLTGARLASEDWSAPLAGRDGWRFDRASAARTFAEEDPDYAVDLVELGSGEWVPLARPAPAAHLTLGLPDLR